MNFASLFYDEIFKLITADYIAVLSIWVQTLLSVFSLQTHISVPTFLKILNEVFRIWKMWMVCVIEEIVERSKCSVFCFLFIAPFQSTDVERKISPPYHLLYLDPPFLLFSLPVIYVHNDSSLHHHYHYPPLFKMNTLFFSDSINVNRTLRSHPSSDEATHSDNSLAAERLVA